MLVSVLMTSYNREKYIAEAIEGVLKSSYINFELIIVDDCSTDSTVSIADSYAKKDKRIKLYVNEKNLGQFSNRNKAAGYASGEFLMNADSDDIIFPDGIENCVNAMSGFKNANFGMYSPLGEKEPYEIESAAALRKHLLQKPFLTIGPGGTIIRRNFFERIRGYTDKYDAAGDMYFNLKACDYSNIIMLPFEFVYYRRHEGQEINKEFSYLYNNYNYLKDALTELSLPLNEKEFRWLANKNKRRLLVNTVKHFLQHRDLSKTKYILKKTGFGIGDAVHAVFHKPLPQ